LDSIFLLNSLIKSKATLIYLSSVNKKSILDVAPHFPLEYQLDMVLIDFMCLLHQYLIH
jgi:hypothetical protein